MRVVYASSQVYAPPDLAGLYTLHDLSLNGRMFHKKLPHYQSEVHSCFLLFGEKSVTKLASTTGSTNWQLTLCPPVAGTAGFGDLSVLSTF